MFYKVYLILVSCLFLGLNSIAVQANEDVLRASYEKRLTELNVKIEKEKKKFEKSYQRSKKRLVSVAKKEFSSGGIKVSTASEHVSF